MQVNSVNIFMNRLSYQNNISDNKIVKFRTSQYLTDTVSFRARRLSIPVEKRMTDYAIKILNENGLKKGQRVYIKGESFYLPFMEILSREAYKMHSGLVQMDVLEESLEALKRKYNKTQELDYVEAKKTELQEDGALFFEFNETNNPYKSARVMKVEAKEEYEKKYTKIPKNIVDLFRINPKEIFKDILDIHDGQPVRIVAEREHLPLVKKLMQYLFSKNKTDIVDISIPNANNKNILLYADEEVLEEIPEYRVKEFQEMAKKDVAQLNLYSPNPRENEGISTKRIMKQSSAMQYNIDLAVASYELSTNVPWTMYYAPTTESTLDAYPELADDKMKRIAKAYDDANKINRVGHMKEHLEELEYRAEKLNKLIEDGYRTFHYISVDPKTNKPDGKTNFKITMSPKSIFQSARLVMSKFNHSPIVNVPSEEVFTAPLSDSAEGKITTTKSLPLNGRTITGLEFEFKNGEVESFSADENAEMLNSYMASNLNADRLGEVAIVAGSPIAKMNRLFNNILLDENAASHLALGTAFPATVKGATEIDSPKELGNYLRKEKINISPAHLDFMVGSKNLVVSAINEATGDSIEIVRNDKFLL